MAGVTNRGQLALSIDQQVRDEQRARREAIFVLCYRSMRRVRAATDTSERLAHILVTSRGYRCSSCGTSGTAIGSELRSTDGGESFRCWSLAAFVRRHGAC